MNWADLEYFDNIYESCHKQVLSKRSTTSIKKRFLNVILPNLYKYNILDVDEILLFYDRAGIDIPPELEQILSNLMEKNSTLVQDEYSLNSTNYNIDGGIILSNIEKNTNMNSQKNTKDIIQQRTEGTNLEKKSSVYNHTDQDNSLNNILQNTNISFNNDKESYAFSNINQSGSSTSKNFHDNNMVENKKNHIYQTENSQESKNIEKIDVAVQANVVNFKIMARFVADQLCLNINNEEHVFVPESKNNKQELMNELNVQHNIIYDNIHVIDNKIYNTLQRFKTLNEILERKILNLKIKNITNPTEIKLLPENFNKIQPLICPCVWKKLKKYIAPAIPVNKRRSRVVHLPVKLQHLNDNKHLEKICKCCTEDKKLKERKKFQKSNVPKANNDNASFLTENKTKGVESNCSTDELQKKNVTDNKNDKAAKLEIDDSSDHSSPIISMSRRNQVTIVNVNSLISRKVQSCNTAKSGENIAGNGHISNINSEILPINYNPSNKAKEDSFSITNINSEILPINPSNRANDDSLSIPFATAEIYDTTMLEYKPEFNYYSSDPLCSSHIPYLNDRDIDSPELSMLPSTLFNRHNEELKLDNDMETINISTFIVQSNTIKNEIEESADRNEITVWPIINEESNIIYSDHNKDKIKSSSSLFYEMDENFDPSTSISYQSHNLFEEEIQQTKLENSVEKDNSVVLNSLNDESINIEFKDDVELNRNTNRSPSCQLKENSSKNQLHNFLDLQVKKDEYNSHLSEINSISQVHYLVSDDNACDNIVLQKTRCTYEKKILSERCRTLNDKKHIESSNLKCETSYSTAKVAMESINTQYLVNIDLDNDTSANNITLPLNFEENSRLEIRSSELSEIRLSSNIEEETKSDSTHLETFKSVPVVVHLKKNQVVKVTKYI